MLILIPWVVPELVVKPFYNQIKEKTPEDLHSLKLEYAQKQGTDTSINNSRAKVQQV